MVEAAPQAGNDKVMRCWRADLWDRLKQDFGVVLHERTVGKLLDALGYRRLSVRPFNPKTDLVVQEDFKKLRSQRSCSVASVEEGSTTPTAFCLCGHVAPRIYDQIVRCSNTIYETYEYIVDACCETWNFFADDLERIASITFRKWAKVNV